MGIVDGLGGEEVNQAVTSTATISGTNVYGTTLVTAPTISGTNIVATGSVTGNQFVANNNLQLAAGSPYGKGVVVQMTARNIISGGMFVIASGGLAMSAPTSSQYPIGVAQATTVSGATVSVLIHGIVPMISEGTIAIGGGVRMGAGGAQNCVVAGTIGSGVRVMGTLSSAGSEGTVFVVL